MEKFPLRSNRPNGSAIIAVVGLPYTKREDFCRDIARWAKCPIFESDVILESLSTTTLYDVDDDIIRFDRDEDDEARLSHTAFDVICAMARTQLDTHLSERYFNVVVLSSPLSNKIQLRQLTEMVQVDIWNRRRLLVIECKRKNEFQWQRIFERGIRFGHQIPGYKFVKSWRDFEKAIYKHKNEGYDDYFAALASAFPPHRVTKLGVYIDTDLDSRKFKEYIDPGRLPPVSEAIEHFLTRDHGEDDQAHQSVVEYAEWRRQRLERGKSGAYRVTDRHYMCQPGHCILRFEELEQEATCDFCEQRVVERSYFCQNCSLSLHKLCAEVPLSREIIESYSRRVIEVFPETHACYSCLGKGRRFSDRCNSCIFRTHLKCRFMPTVLRHDCDGDHILSICLLWESFTASPFYCKACGLMGFWNSYGCNICRAEYHLECLNLPLETKREHGGHLHSVKLEFSCGREEDEYKWCLGCYKDIDPETWVYTCQECDYVAHLYCVFPSIAEEYGVSDIEL